MGATIVIDLGYGDSGKGTIVDYLTRKHGAKTIIKHSGGPQNAHNVVLPGGTYHCFSQFGSGTLAGASTYISKYCYVDPVALINEGMHLQLLGVKDVWEKIKIDKDCLIVTPYHAMINRIKESKRQKEGNPHGSCGRGINETVQFSIDFPEFAPRYGDLATPTQLEQKLRFLRHKTIEFTGFSEYEALGLPTVGQLIALYYGVKPIENIIATIDQIKQSEELIFEGSQGVLLDEHYGFFPHVTRSTTTFKNADSILFDLGYKNEVTKVGVIRSYMTRHGAGPFPTEEETLLEEYHNKTGKYQGAFRTGVLDIVALQYAILCAGKPDYLAMTCIDRLEEMPEYLRYKMACDYSYKGMPCRKVTNLTNEQLMKCSYFTTDALDKDNFLYAVESELEVPIEIASYGPTYLDKRINKFATSLTR